MKINWKPDCDEGCCEAAELPGGVRLEVSRDMAKRRERDAQDRDDDEREARSITLQAALTALGGGCTPEHAWDEAEAFVAEGQKRGVIPGGAPPVQQDATDRAIVEAAKRYAEALERDEGMQAVEDDLVDAVKAARAPEVQR